MEHKPECGIARDLMPLCLDDLASGASRDLVRRHLETCPACRQEWETLQADRKSPPPVRKTETKLLRRVRKKLKRRRILQTVYAVFLTLVLVTGIVSMLPPSVDLGESELYSLAERQEAADVIRREFAQWRGNKLYALNYCGDQRCQNDLSYCNTLREEGEPPYTECIVFSLVYRSPLFASGGWTENTVYQWSWYLVRTEEGSWKTLTYGMP